MKCPDCGNEKVCLCLNCKDTHDAELCIELRKELDAHREAVRVAAKAALKDGQLDWAEHGDGSWFDCWPDFIWPEVLANPILAAAIKSAQEGQQ